MTYIYGIGRSTARKILEVAGISYDLKVQDWSDDQIGAIRSTIADMGIKVEGECRSAVQLNIKRLMDIGCYRGNRHRLGLYTSRLRDVRHSVRLLLLCCNGSFE